MVTFHSGFPVGESHWRRGSLEMRNAVAIIFLVVLCAGCKRPADVRMEAFAKSVQQTVNPVEFESWATMVISNTPKEQFFRGIPTNGVPKGVQNLMTDYATLCVGGDRLSNDVVVMYIRGSGFGHWGFAVGTPGYTCGLGKVQSHWTNGIWFWTE